MATNSQLTVKKVPNSADILKNTSKIQITLTVTTSGESWNAEGDTEGYVSIDGVQVASLNGKKFYKNSTTTIYSETHTIQHDANGEKEVNVTTSFDTKISARVLNDTVTLKLDRIRRVAFLSVPVMTLGQEVTIPVTNSAGLAYSVSYAFGAQSGVIVENSIAEEVTWTPPLELAREIPENPSGKGTLTVTSYRDGAVEAEYPYDFTAIVPDSLAPEISGATFSFVGGGSGWNVGVKGKTRLSFRVSAQGKLGTGIASCAVSFGGASGSGLTGETGVLTQAGKFAPKVTVTDKRGKSTVMRGAKMQVYDYTTPSFISSAAYRSDEDGTPMASGTIVTVTAAASYAPIGGLNSATLKARSRMTGGLWSDYTELTAQQNNYLSNFSKAVSYEVEVMVVDALGENRSVTYSIPPDSVTFHLRPGGKGAAFGAYSEKEEYVETAWPLDMMGNRVENVGAPVQGTDAANKAYVDSAPEMLMDTEYKLREKWNGGDVYQRVIDYGALPNAKEGYNYKLPSGLNVINICGIAVGSDYTVPIPGYYAIKSMGYTKADGNLWVETTTDMSSYHGYITVKYTK